MIVSRLEKCCFHDLLKQIFCVILLIVDLFLLTLNLSGIILIVQNNLKIKKELSVTYF